MRRNLFDFDQVLNTQRNKVYATRRQALLAPDLSNTIIEFAEQTADDILEVRPLLLLTGSLPRIANHVCKNTESCSKYGVDRSA